jgi:nucleoid DNA-binding protein
MDNPDIKTLQIEALDTETVDPQLLRSVVQILASKEFLAREEWFAYFRAKIRLGDYLFDQIDVAGTSGKLAEAVALCGELAQLNLTFRSRIERMLQPIDDDDDPLSEDERQEMLMMIQDCELTAALTEGNGALYSGTLERLQGNPTHSVASFVRAGNIFDAGADLLKAKDLRDLELHVVLGLKSSIAKYNAHISSGLQHMLAREYVDAKNEILTARVEISKLLDNAQQVLDPKEPEKIERSINPMESDLSAVMCLYEACEFYSATTEGEFQAAIDAATRLTAHSAATIERLREAGSGSAYLSLASADHSSYVGWSYYAQAELATDEGQWSKALDLLTRARTQWSEAAMNAIASGLPQGRALADRLLSQATMVIQACTRRCKRERELNQRISALETKLEESQRITIGQVGAFAVKESDQHRGVNMGHNINVGNSAVITIDSILNNVRQTVEDSKHLDDEQKTQLEVLVRALTSDLERLNSTHADESKEISEALNKVVAIATKPPEARKRSVLELSAKGLKEAATLVKDIAPSVLATAGLIAKFVTGL